MLPCPMRTVQQCGSSNKNKDKRQAIIKHAINTMLKPKMRPVSLPPKTVFLQKIDKSANEENALKRIYAAPGGGRNINKDRKSCVGVDTNPSRVV